MIENVIRNNHVHAQCTHTDACAHTHRRARTHAHKRAGERTHAHSCTHIQQEYKQVVAMRTHISGAHPHCVGAGAGGRVTLSVRIVDVSIGRPRDARDTGRARGQ
ncbi:hypothetical protein EVAR_60340_1 [Eumeta japonica]|uniref:Uncharacterized protein n=1 Tax=Eumeta variegata TaxID=151549 RepID=A0A4C1Z4C7_EUMVA|nr:hypothetical protein EVAR_60340_1 [Eumeta japonica]